MERSADEINILSCIARDIDAPYIQHAGKHHFYTPFSNPYNHVDPLQFCDLENSIIFALLQDIMRHQHSMAPVKKATMISLLKILCRRQEIRGGAKKSIFSRVRLIYNHRLDTGHVREQIAAVQAVGSTDACGRQLPHTNGGVAAMCQNCFDILNRVDVVDLGRMLDMVVPSRDWSGLITSMIRQLQQVAALVSYGEPPQSEKKCQELMIGLGKLYTQISHLDSFGYQFRKHGTLGDPMAVDFALKTYGWCVVWGEVIENCIDADI